MRRKLEKQLISLVLALVMIGMTAVPASAKEACQPIWQLPASVSDYDVTEDEVRSFEEEYERQLRGDSISLFSVEDDLEEAAKEESIEEFAEKKALVLTALYGLTSVQYALIEDGEITVTGTSGYTDKDTKKEADGSTMYGIGSVSKMFTTIAVLQLVEEGKIDLDKPVVSYIPEFKMADDEHDAEKSVNAYNDLKDWGMQMLVGTVTSAPCIAVEAEAINDNMFLLTPSGTAVSYTLEDPTYVLDLLSSELSSIGKGDYKEPSLIIDNGQDFILDLIYVDYKINDTFTSLNTLPSMHGKLQELVIYLKDKVLDIYVELHYVIDEENDIIIRNIKVINKQENPIKLHKVMSMQLEMVNKQFEMISLYGGWGFEGQKSKVTLDHNIIINDSKTGNSSNRHNPFFMLKSKDANYNYGDVYSFNLIYSGNHYEMVEHSSFNKVRIQSGINPYGFLYTLKQNEEFETPYAIMTYSNKGINKASQNMHCFISNHILNEKHQDMVAPILINNWEATYMKFKESNLKNIIKTSLAFILLVSPCFLSVKILAKYSSPSFEFSSPKTV